MSDSWRFISTIAKKEIVEFVRDWRTLIALIVIPLLIFPALFIALPLLLQSEAAELDAMELEVVWQGDVNDELNISFAESNLIIVYEEMPSEINNLSDIGNDLDRIRNQETQAVFRLLENDSGWKFSGENDPTEVLSDREQVEGAVLVGTQLVPTFEARTPKNNSDLTATENVSDNILHQLVLPCVICLHLDRGWFAACTILTPKQGRGIRNEALVLARLILFPSGNCFLCLS